MKKYITILGTILALAACTKEIQEEKQPETQAPASSEIKLNITIGRADDFAETKANVKTDWAIDDEVYLLFKDLLTGENPQYIVMRRSGTGNWVGTGKNGLTSENVPTSGLLTAIFFPYGKGANIVAYADPSSPRENPTYTHYEFLFNNDPYCGYFLKAENVPFTYDQTAGLTSTLMLGIPELAENEVLVHFDISGGYDRADELFLYQEYVHPIVFMNVTADGTVTMGKADAGKEIPGYNDTGFRSFSGICEKKTTNTDFDFMIVDETNSMLYARSVAGKKITKNIYIGLGGLYASSWNKHAFVDLGLIDNVNNRRILWATENVGNGIDSFIDEDDGKSKYNQGYYLQWGALVEHYKDQSSWSNYRFYDKTNDVITKYNDTDHLYTLEPQDDAATYYWEKPWRMPTRAEWQALMDECVWEDVLYDDDPDDPRFFVTKVKVSKGPKFLYLTTYPGDGRYWSSERTTYASLKNNLETAYEKAGIALPKPIDEMIADWGDLQDYADLIIFENYNWSNPALPKKFWYFMYSDDRSRTANIRPVFTLPL